MPEVTDWLQFQTSLRWPHGDVHMQIGGIMANLRSPADPFFWLHHGFIDKVWADWQKSDNGTDPTNATSSMPRSPALPKQVSATIKTEDLGYIYLDYSGGA